MGYENFGNRLLEMRQNKKLTQEELASRLGVTPQAVSKWERGTGLPDIELLCEIGKVFGTTLDTLLNISAPDGNEKGMITGNDSILRDILADPLVLNAGSGFVEFLITENEDGFKKLADLRQQLAKDYGYLLPLIRIKDDMNLDENQYQILIYDKVILDKRIECLSKYDFNEIYKDLKDICIKNYSLILNRQLVKNLVEHLKSKYPAVVEGIVPDKLSYAGLQKVLASLAAKGKPIHNLIQIIEMTEDYLEEGLSISSICENIGKQL